MPKIVSQNVNGVETKVEKSNISNLLKQYDTVNLNEVKMQIPVSLTGYVSYKSDVRESDKRGGTVVLFKNYFISNVTSVDTSVKDQVWLKLRSVSKCLFECEFSHNSFVLVQEKEFCINGDLNA